MLLDWDSIVSKRVAPWGRPRLKYFQYLCLLAVEHFLTCLGDDSLGLLAELNTFSEAAPYTERELTKLAVSIATGAGKTLLMHANIKQWLRLVGRDTVDAVILITPSELLSRQHLAELLLSGIDAALFDPAIVTLFDNDVQVKIIDINKFREQPGPTTVAVESFGTRNLVVIDEAHRGSRSDDRIWKDYRDRLSRDGYAFEYSATFRQAVAAARDPALCKEYEKAIVFDYPYREFWNDGFGKDFRVRNAEFADDSEEASLYFVAAILIFFQQQVVFGRDLTAAKASAIEAPLLLAVGTTVQKADSDISNLLVRFRDFIEHRADSIRRITRLLDDDTALVAIDDQPLVFSDLHALRKSFVTVDNLYDALRHGIFNAGLGGAMRLTRFTGVPGEIHISVGAGRPFGLVNVGDASSLFSHLTRDAGFVGFEEPGSDGHALFDEVSAAGSSITVLIGARKFLEGWNSNRPSSMLLLNVGKSEGSQVIQLFGRGVRLRGYEGSLTRSNRDLYRPPAPKNMHLLETLELFGIRADYVKRLRLALDVEGIRKTFDAERKVETTVNIPKSPPLKVLRPEGLSYIEAHSEVTFDALSDKLRVALDWYPRVLSYGSTDASAQAVQRRTLRLSSGDLAFIDLNQVYRAMLGHKRARRWENLVIPRRAVNDLFGRDDWYTLYASEETLRPANLSSIRTWQNIAEALAVAYLSEWYRTRLREHEASRLTVRELSGDDPAIVTAFSVRFDGADQRVQEILGGAPREAADPLEMIHLSESLYKPLMYVSDRNACTTVPTALVASERDFVTCINEFVCTGGLGGADVRFYLLRNASRGRGIGFAEAENFHPDFILWFYWKDAQVIIFVEPHGLAYEPLGFASHKVQFSKTICNIERRINDPLLRLAAAIVSPTPRAKVKWASNATKSELDEYNIFFAEDAGYIARLMGKGLNLLAELSAPSK